MSTTEASTNTLSPQEDWTRSDLYHNSFLIPKDEILEFARKNSDDSGLPSIAVSPAQGKLLNLIARSVNAKRILEVGTLGGSVLPQFLLWPGRIRNTDLTMLLSDRYSTIWLARALPDDGLLVSAELHQKHADVRVYDSFYLR